MEGLLLLLVLLACPLMMYFCMRGMGHQEKHKSHSPVSQQSEGLGDFGLAERITELETQQQALLDQMTALQSSLQQVAMLGEKLTAVEAQQKILLDQMTMLQRDVQLLSGIETARGTE